MFHQVRARSYSKLQRNKSSTELERDEEIYQQHDELIAKCSKLSALIDGEQQELGDELKQKQLFTREHLAAEFDVCIDVLCFICHIL